MANFLIYNKTHWMELPSKAARSKTGYQNCCDKIDASGKIPSVIIAERAELKRKYDARYVIGDIVDIRDKLGLCGLESNHFLLVKVTGITAKEAADYLDPKTETNANGQVKTIRRRKFNIDISGLTFANKETSITLDEFKKLVKEK